MRGSGLRCEWQAPYSSSSLAADATIEHAREADLVVIGQVDPERSMVEREFAERVVMGSGRPVLLVPHSGRFERVGCNVVIGWNGKREAARAAFDAIPILKRSEIVRVTWIDPQKTLETSTALPGAELAVALSRHEIDALAEGYPTDDLPDGVALQARATDAEADLLVMGAYGHSRMREIVFGGATCGCRSSCRTEARWETIECFALVRVRRPCRPYRLSFEPL
jgi:nucleotide-binding universal stress UspA family protein